MSCTQGRRPRRGCGASVRDLHPSTAASSPSHFPNRYERIRWPRIEAHPGGTRLDRQLQADKVYNGIVTSLGDNAPQAVGTLTLTRDQGCF